jgi:dinuclear metal center YbgI/SA1388 family protein
MVVPFFIVLTDIIATFMTIRIKDIIFSLNIHAPFNLSESWDNVGLLLGDMEREVSSVLIGLDPSSSLIDEAIAIGADTIITHHPLIFKPLPTINTAEPVGRFIEKAISHKISVIACHTNLDSAADGVSDALAKSLGLSELQPLLANPATPHSAQGMGRIGRFAEAVTAPAFLRLLGKALDLPAVFIAGRLPATISTVALCGGSGSNLATVAYERGADLYLTAEIKHNIARWAEEHEFCLIEGTHYGTERHAVALLAEILNTENLARDWGISITQTQTEYHPFVLTHTE